MPSKKVATSDKGLTVRLNLFSLEPYIANFDSEKARLPMKGHVVNEQTGEKKVFNDAGDLIKALGKWNSRAIPQPT